jgi:small subunit ribosomal protein S20
MAQIKSQMKRILTNEKKKLANASFRTSLKTALKNVELAVAKNEKANAIAALNLAYTKLDKSVSKGIHHKNYANREKSRLAEKINSLK